MILEENNTFTKALEEAEKNIRTYIYCNRIDLFNQSIQERLKNNLKDYNEEMDWKISQLNNRGNVTVLKALTKLQKKEDKQAILNKSNQAKGE